jgi:hypothetical protein
LKVIPLRNRKRRLLVRSGILNKGCTVMYRVDPCIHNQRPGDDLRRLDARLEAVQGKAGFRQFAAGRWFAGLPFDRGPRLIRGLPRLAMSIFLSENRFCGILSSR